MQPNRIVRMISTVAALLAAAAVLLPVAAYLLFSARFLAGTVSAEAEVSAGLVDHVVAANPELWRYEHVRLLEVLSSRPDGDPEEWKGVQDASGATVVDLGRRPGWPVISSTFPIRDAGVAVGSVEVARSLRPVVLRAGLLLAVLTPLGAFAFLLLRRIPLRAIRQGEAALRTSEARFRALIEKSTDMIFVFDAEKRILFWSPSATEILGWTADEVVGKRLSDLGLVHPDDVPLLAEVTRSVAAGPGRVGSVAIRHRHKDGSWRFVEGSGRNLADDPAVGGVVVNARDVTEQRRLEEQVRQSQKLESIGRLAGGVAHDFNNLLTVILSSAASMREALVDGRPVDFEDVEQVEEAGERARDFTGQLLAFARRQVIAPLPVDLNEVVRRSERLLRRVLGEDVRLEVRAALDLWSVLADAGQMEQLLLNLAANARDAMPRGGVVSIETRNAHLDPTGPDGGGSDGAGEWVLLVVRDTGSGMTLDVRERLFEPFFTTKELGKGTGLGLATVHGIVTQNGGRVLVESEPGEGTTFEIRFPRTLAPAGPAPEPRPVTAPARPGTETVLVVEDDPRVRTVTVRALTGAGHRVLTAASGGEALALAEAEADPIHLVVADVVMPGMSGRAVVDALRARRPGMRALFVSGYPQDVIARRGVLDSGVEFLSKPFTPATLVARVRSLLDA